MKRLLFIFLFLGLASSAQAKFETVEEYREYVKDFTKKKVSRLKKKCVKTKGLKGKMMLLWEVGEGGKATDFTRGKDTVDNSDLYHCFEKEISRWKFQSPPQDQVVEIEYEFRFP